ncbi:hypothetical protein TGRUB_429450 [Toxoplasma gondii RUB]|uniref:Uncharacterized protein n=1 Tax=Toxoplasma gondii RUB TaxID=935652 RepID=A0A086M677_TOXGO|nr:hypothetical protein TGRUB_429450 [Toxoplasma gondii RUB]
MGILSLSCILDVCSFLHPDHSFDAGRTELIVGSYTEPPSPSSPAGHFLKKAMNAKSVLTAVVEIFSEHSPMFGEEMEERDPHTLGPEPLTASCPGGFSVLPAALSVVGQLIAELLALARREQAAVGKAVVDVLASLIVERNAPLLLGREQEKEESDVEDFSGRAVDEASEATRSQASDASKGRGSGMGETETPLTDNDLNGHDGRGDKNKEFWVLSAAAREERHQRQSRKGGGPDLRLQDNKDYQLEPTMAEVSLRLAPSTVCVLLEAFEAAEVFRDLLKPVQRLLAFRLNLFRSYASFLLRSLPPSESPLVPSSRLPAHFALSPSAIQSPCHAAVSAGGDEHLTHAAGSRNQFQSSATATDWSHGYIPCGDLVSLLALSAACVGVPDLTGDALWALLQGHDLAAAALSSLHVSHRYLPMSDRAPSMLSASSELPSAPEIVPSLPRHRSGLHQLSRCNLADADGLACNAPALRTGRDKDGEWISEEPRKESGKDWQAGRETVAVVQDVLSTALSRLASPLREALSHVLSMIADHQSLPSVQELCLSHLPFFFVQWLSLRKRVRHAHDSTVGVRTRFEMLEAHALVEEAKASERGGEIGHSRVRTTPPCLKQTLSETLSDEDEEDSLYVGREWRLRCVWPWNVLASLCSSASPSSRWVPSRRQRLALPWTSGEADGGNGDGLRKQAEQPPYHRGARMLPRTENTRVDGGGQMRGSGEEDEDAAGRWIRMRSDMHAAIHEEASDRMVDNGVFRVGHRRGLSEAAREFMCMHATTLLGGK